MAAKNAEDTLVEVVEIKDHPFMVGAQFHPEFTSRPNKPNPLLNAFVEASILFSENKQTSKLKNKSK